MSSKSRTLVRAPLKNTLLPRNLLRAGNAGVINDSMGGSASATRIAQQGFARGVIKKMTVWGVDDQGRAHDKVEFSVRHGHDGEEFVAISSDDSVDYVTRTDPGMAQAIRHTRARYDRKGLTAQTDFEFSDHILRDPERYAQEQAALGTVTGTAPDWADGCNPHHVATVIPGRDPNQNLSLYHGSRKGRR